MEEHINTAKENPAFKIFVSLLEREIRDKQTPSITKEDQFYNRSFYNNL